MGTVGDHLDAVAGLRAFVYHPGIVDTPIHDNWPLPFRLLLRYFMWPWTITAERSASVPLEVVDGQLAPTSHLFDSKRLKIAREVDWPTLVFFVASQAFSDVPVVDTPPSTNNMSR